MKKTLLILAAIATVACTKTQEKGLVRFGVGFETEDTKAALNSSELLSSAKVNIYYADFSGMVASYTYSEMPAAIYLPAADYRVDVIAGEAAKVAPRRSNFEQISFKGSTPFTVTGGKDVNVLVEAKVSCAVTKVIFDETVLNNFRDDFTLTIGPDKDNLLSYGSSLNGAPGYIIVSDLDDKKLEWKFSGVRLKTGTTLEKSGVIENVEGGKAYELKIKFTMKGGDVDFNVYVDTSLIPIQQSIIFEPVSTGLAASASYEIWAAHATVHADVDEGEYSDPSKIKFSYSKDGKQWSETQAERVSEGVYQAVLKGLSPATNYTYRLLIDGEVIGKELTLTTESAPAIPNGDFEQTSKSSSGAYYEFYNPSSSDPACREPWWGSGNGANGVSGSADMGYVITVPDTSTKVSGSTSVCCQSAWAVVKFAAGNIFSGSFAGLVGTTGGMVNFGRPFTGRPTAIRFWAKYSGGKINRIDSYPSGQAVTTNDYDQARIQCALGVWTPKEYGGTKSSPILWNTTNKSTFVDFWKDKATVAYNEVSIKSDASGSTNQWKEFTVKLQYRDEKTMPQYVVISCASSYLGDYFTGCDSAKLWLDKMEFIYE